MENLNSIELIAQLVSKATPPVGMRTRIIAIDGCGGAGKSTLATSLSIALNQCPVIHTDDFASWDHPLNWYPRMIEQVLTPLSQNHAAHFQRYDWGTQKLADWINIEPQEFIIVEGVSSSRSEFRPYLSFSVFVTASAETRLQRGLVRDGEAAREQWLKWMAEEKAYIERDHLEKFANVVVDGESDFRILAEHGCSASLEIG